MFPFDNVIMARFGYKACFILMTSAMIQKRAAIVLNYEIQFTYQICLSVLIMSFYGYRAHFVIFFIALCEILYVCICVWHGGMWYLERCFSIYSSRYNTLVIDLCFSNSEPYFYHVPPQCEKRKSTYNHHGWRGLITCLLYVGLS